MAFNKLLKRDLNFISNFISDKESKKIFNTTVFGKPNDVKKQYFNMLND